MKCEVCTENEAKYRCPKCLKRTCSLHCVNAHKKEKPCDGMRNKTAYVRMKEFTDLNLLSDYRFLEDAGRKSYGASKDLANKKRHFNYQSTQLQKLCVKRGIKLRLMPYPMSKRKNNNSFIEKATKSIIWRVEWIFPQSEAKYSTRVSENDSLSKALCHFIHPEESDPVKRQKLKSYVQKGMEHTKLFMKVENSPANNERFFVLEKDKTLNENLQGRLVIEYPSIYVVEEDKADNYKVHSTDESAGTDSGTSDSSSSSETDTSSSESEETEKGTRVTDTVPAPDSVRVAPESQALDTVTETNTSDQGNESEQADPPTSDMNAKTPPPATDGLEEISQCNVIPEAIAGEL